MYVVGTMLKKKKNYILYIHTYNKEIKKKKVVYTYVQKRIMSFYLY